MSKIMETSQFAALMAAVATALPRDMDSTTAQGWITNPKALEKALREAFVPPKKEENKFVSKDIAERYGYTVIKDRNERTKFEMKDLEYIRYLEDHETFIDGANRMRRRAEKLGALFSLADGMYMLEHQRAIPTGTYFYIVLAATVLMDSEGEFTVPCLHRHGSEWMLDFRRFIIGHHRDGRLPRLKSRT